MTEIFLAIGHLKEQIKEYFGNGEKFGVNIKYFIEEKPLGTGGWMHQGKDLLKEDFFVVNGDNLFAADLVEMMRFHKEQKALATIGLTKVKDPSSFGIALMKETHIESFIEKPKREEAPSDLASSGYYIFNQAIFEYRMQEEKFMLEHDVFPIVAAERKLVGFPSDKQWFDTGTPERLEEVNAHWKQ